MLSSPVKNKNKVLNIRIADIKKDISPSISENRTGKSENGVREISKKLNITPKPNG